MSFSFGSFAATGFGLNITSRQVYDAPAYDLTSVDVPGKSGNVLIPQNRFKNKIISYRGYLVTAGFAGDTDWEKMSSAAVELKGKLLAGSGEYQRLSDSYDLSYVRQAYVESIKITPVQDQPFGAEVEVTFNAKPFMWDAFSGSTTITNGSTTLTNPYYFESLPKIEITPGTGLMNFTVNGETWTINGTYIGVVGDAEEMEWYSVDQYGEPVALINNKVSGPTPFPVLTSGANTVGITSGITSLKISPRWRTL